MCAAGAHARLKLSCDEGDGVDEGPDGLELELLLGGVVAEGHSELKVIVRVQ